MKNFINISDHSSSDLRAIIDEAKTRKLSRKGLNKSALLSYENELRPLTNRITLINRQAGPDALLQVVEDRCDGKFIEIEDVISKKEMKEHADKYKTVAGINIQRLNNSKGILSKYF